MFKVIDHLGLEYFYHSVWKKPENLVCWCQVLYTFAYTQYFVIFAFNATKTAGGHTDDSTGLEHRKRYQISNILQTKYLCVLIHIWIKGEVGAVKPV